MRKSIFIFVFALLSSLSAFAQANFAFEKTDHDFGTVAAGDDTLWVDFKFTNTGSEALSISDVRTSCDCTLAEWPKEPVQPGKSAIIRGGFKIKDKTGRFEKSIIIFANTVPAMTMLNLTGNVLAPAEK
ncbi:MAG: DUF1573 domain-containing protein [Cytophagaceae bacterium]|nr:DUF1573 domain-containing protein [Cytophagaceae bacterium]